MVKLLKTRPLKKVVEKIKRYYKDDFNDVVYLDKGSEWLPDSAAYIYRIGDDDDMPTETDNKVYFLELDLIDELVDMYKELSAAEKQKATIFEFVVYYAQNDAYLFNN